MRVKTVTPAERNTTGIRWLRLTKGIRKQRMRRMIHNNLLERIVEKNNMNRAYKQVVHNKGAAGVDGMGCEELFQHLRKNGKILIENIKKQTYKPLPVRRVEIPKPDGTKRKLGVPTVTDRLVQQATAQILSPIYEAQFHNNSYGFRPGRNAQQAVLKATEYINEGYNWVVDLDLEKFFDTVNHDKLLSILNKTIKDGRVLSLIRKFLVSGVIIGGSMEDTEIGTPQGGNLSPLLANVLLNEFDWELDKRGHKFVRYADDCIILVRSEKAANRVMQSVTKYLETVLKLKVNTSKSKIDRPTGIKFLGFTFYNQFKLKKYKPKAHPKSVEKVIVKIKGLTKRSWGVSNKYKAMKINEVIRGWINYFKIGALLSIARKLDRIIRYRFRMCIWKHWKTNKNRYKNLIKLGVYDINARKVAGNHGYARVCRSKPICFAMSNDRLKKFGLLSAEEYFIKVSC